MYCMKGRADNDNRRNLLDICDYVYNQLPASCHGSEMIVKSWLIADKEQAAKANGGVEQQEGE